MGSKIRKIAPVVIGWVGVILRAWVVAQSIAKEPYWYDEAFTWIVAGRPLADLITATAADVHPPLWYLLVKLAGALGPVPIESARWLPFAFSVGALYIAWDLSGLLGLSYGARLGSLAALAIMPTQLFYAAELRMYAALEFIVLVQVWSIYRGRWWLLGLSTAAGLYLHNYAVLYSVVLYLVAVGRFLFAPVPVRAVGVTKDPGPGFLAALAAPWILYAPWAIAVLVKQITFVRSGAHWAQPINAGDLLQSLPAAAVGVQVPNDTGPVFYLVFMVAMVAGIVAGAKNKRYGLIVWAVGPLLLAALGSVIVSPMLVYRGFIGSVPGLYMLIADSISRSNKNARAYSTVILAGAAAVCLVWFMSMVQTGTVKGVVYNARADYSGLVVHLEDTSFISYAAQNQTARHVLLDACPEQIAALGPVVRAAMGKSQTIKPEQLPGRFTLIGIVGGFSTLCHEQTWARIVAGQQPRELQISKFYIYGVWNVEK